jgi:hypothetical protein
VAGGAARVLVQRAWLCKVGSWPGFPAIGGAWVLLRRNRHREATWSRLWAEGCAEVGAESTAAGGVGV